jgi:membrane-associated phospholipid phosphatase
MPAASTPDQTRGSRIAALGGRAVTSVRHDPRSRRIAVLIVLLVADLAALAHIVEDYVTGDPIVRWDVSFARWLFEHSNPTVVEAAKIVTWLGNGIFLAALVAWLAMRRLHRTRWRLLVAISAAFVIVAVGFTRMYLGVHYLSDVLAGTAAGLAWAFATILAATIDRDVLGMFPRPLQRLVLRLVPR